MEGQEESSRHWMLDVQALATFIALCGNHPFLAWCPLIPSRKRLPTMPQKMRVTQQQHQPPAVYEKYTSKTRQYGHNWLAIFTTLPDLRLTPGPSKEKRTMALWPNNSFVLVHDQRVLGMHRASTPTSMTECQHHVQYPTNQHQALPGYLGQSLS